MMAALFPGHAMAPAVRARISLLRDRMNDGGLEVTCGGSSMEPVIQRGAKVRVFDPQALEETRRLYSERPDLTYCGSADEAVQGADAIVLVTEWHVFRNPDFGRIKQALKQPVIFDGRNVYEPRRLLELGYEYFAVGRPNPR